MKKILTLSLIVALTLCLFVPVYALENSDFSWEIIVKNKDGDTNNFKQGDIIELSVVNKKDIYDITDSVVHLTYNGDLLEYASEEDIKAFNEELSVPYSFCNSIGAANTNNGGVFTAAFISSEGVSFLSDAAVFKVYFKVTSEEIYGVLPLNFRWIKKGVYASYACDTDGNNLDIDYKDSYLNVSGDELSSLPTSLPGDASRTFVPTTQPTEDVPEEINLNGTYISLKTPYFVSFSKLAVTNSAFKKAGIIISEKNGDGNLTLESENIITVEAKNIGSNNCFGFLVYGKGVKTGTTYYTRIYETYEDGSVIYADVIPIEIREDK